MEELVKTFHIDIKILLAQIINFALVLAVLYKFAYKPILKTLNARTRKIEKGIKHAEDMSHKLAELEKKEREVITEARKESQKIIAVSQISAEKNKEEIICEAKAQSEKILEDARKKIEEEKKKMFLEIKSEVADLAILATEKILKEKIDNKNNEGLIVRAIK